MSSLLLRVPDRVRTSEGARSVTRPRHAISVVNHALKEAPTALEEAVIVGLRDGAPSRTGLSLRARVLILTERSRVRGSRRSSSLLTALLRSSSVLIVSAGLRPAAWLPTDFTPRPLAARTLSSLRPGPLSQPRNGPCAQRMAHDAFESEPLRPALSNIDHLVG